MRLSMRGSSTADTGDIGAGVVVDWLGIGYRSVQRPTWASTVSSICETNGCLVLGNCAG